MGITQMARCASRGGVVMLQDASEDVTVDDLAFLAGRGTEAGGGDAVEVTKTSGGGLVEERDGVGMEDVAITAGTAEAHSQVVGGVVGPERIDREPTGQTGVE